MSYQATVFNVLVASPGDVAVERDIARGVINEWNAAHTRSSKVILQAISWDTHSHPSMGDRPQGVINRQILEEADLLVGIFWSRIGTPTGQAPGGSVEELQRHMERGKPTMIYFSEVPGSLAMGADPQYLQLMTWRKAWCEPRGLVATFETHEEFKNKFGRQLASKLNDDPYFKTGNREIPGYVVDLGSPPEPMASQNSLSTEAKVLLLETAKDKNGYIIARATVSAGLQIASNRKRFIEENNPRTRALWQAALEQLATVGLIEERAKGLYQITDAGYKMADVLDQ